MTTVQICFCMHLSLFKALERDSLPCWPWNEVKQCHSACLVDNLCTSAVVEAIGSVQSAGQDVVTGRLPARWQKGL